MGLEISYCNTCGARLTTSDFENKKAFRVEEMSYCAKCAPTKIPESKPAAFSRLPVRRPAGATLSKDTARATTRAFGSAPSRPRKSATLFGIIGGGIFVTVIVLVFAMGSGNPGNPPPSPKPPKGGTAKVKPPPPKVGPLERARAYRRDHPDDLIGQLREYQKAAWQLPPSRVEECQDELKTVKAALQKKLDAELAELEKKITGPIGEKKFEEAEEILQEALARYDTPMWSLGVGKKIGRVKDLRYEAGSIAPESEPPAGTLGEGLLGWWKFDEGSGDTAADASGNGRDAVLKNGLTWTGGKFGGALAFDGEDDYLEIPKTAGLDITSKDFSVSAWLKLRPQKNYHVILNKMNDERGLGLEATRCKDAKYNIKVLLNHDNTRGWSFSDLFQKETWQHLAFTVDHKENKLNFYANGAHAGSKKLTSNQGSFGKEGALVLGTALQGSRRTPFSGDLDDVRVYDRALTAEEVKALAR